jgi:hypothetical protein
MLPAGARISGAFMATEGISQQNLLYKTKHDCPKQKNGKGLLLFILSPPLGGDGKGEGDFLNID